MNRHLCIVTPVLNGERYIRELLNSVASLQIDVEHIIVDGGSRDATLAIVSEFPSVRILHQTEATGMYGAVAQGFASTNAPLLAYVNADDAVVPAGFERLYRTCASGGPYHVAYGNCTFVYQQSGERCLVRGRRFAKFHLRNGLMPFCQPAAIYSRALYNIVGGLRYDKFRICGDLDLFQRFALQSCSAFEYVKTEAAYFRKHGESLGDRNTALNDAEKQSLTAGTGTSHISKLLFKLS